MALMHAAAAQSSYAYQTLPFMLMFALFNQNRSNSALAQDDSGMSMSTSNGLYGTSPASSLPNMPESMMNKHDPGIVSIDPSLYGNDNTQAMKHLLQKLLDRQDRRIRPNLGGEPVKVGITMFITTISKINEAEMDYTVDFYFRQYWKDHRLAFNASFLRNKYVSVGAEFLSRIWVPDTFFPNEKQSYFHEATTTNKFVRISPDGSVYNSVRMTVIASCGMDLTYFPMDRQRCKIEVESYGYGMNDILYYWESQYPKPSAEMDSIELPQFDVWPKLACHNNTIDISLASGRYSRLVCEFLFVRRMGYYLIQIYIPSGLIVIISWVSFWLSRDSTPARVQLGVIVVLAMTTLMSSTTASLPKVSYIKSIDVYLGTCFVMVFASLVEYATVGYTAKRMKMRRAHEKLQEHLANQHFRANSVFGSNFRGGESIMELEPSPSKFSVVVDERSGRDGVPMSRRSFSVRGGGATAELPSSSGMLPVLVKTEPGSEKGWPPGDMLESLRGEPTRYGPPPPLPFHRPPRPRRHDFNPSEIDKYSRIVFPLAFVAFNIVYWFAYLHVANMVDKEMIYSYADIMRNNADDEGEPVRVGITLFITTISKINEGEMDYTVDFYFRQYWKDHRLAFNASFLRDKYVSVGSEFLSKIWVPDTFFPNEKRSFFHDATTTNKFIRISPDGSVYNSVRMTVTASCGMNLTYFPMDRQRCKIEIESYGYGVNDILYYWQPQDPKPSAEMDNIELPQFIVWPKGVCHNNTIHIVLASGKYSRLVCEFLFVRSMGYYLIQIYIPAGLIVIISWVSFWLSRDSTPARVALGVTVVLAMTTLMSGTTASLPKVSYVKSIDVYLGTCFVMVFASLLEYAAVGYTAKRMKMRRAREKLREHVTSRFRAGSFAASRFMPAQPIDAAPAVVMVPSGPPPPFSSNTLERSGLLAMEPDIYLGSDIYGGQHRAQFDAANERPMDSFEAHRMAMESGDLAAAARDTLRRESLMHPKNTEVRFKGAGGWTSVEPTNQTTVNLRHHFDDRGGRNNPDAAAPNATASPPAIAAAAAAAAAAENSGENRLDALESGLYGFPFERGGSFSHMGSGGGGGGSRHGHSKRRREFNPSEIDKYSRIVFPLAFVAFNIVYWFAYLHVANMVDKELIYSYSDLTNTNTNSD